MKCVCIDDEQVFRRQVGMIADRYRKRNSAQIEMRFYEKPELLLYDLKEHEFYDLYLLDIVLGGDMNGLKLAGEILKRDEQARIVFLTSYSEFALEGYEYHPFHYILKSRVDRLESILEQVTRKMEEEKNQIRLIPRRSGVEKVRYREICYVYKKGKNSIYVCVDGRNRAERKSLTQLREELCVPQMLAVGKSFIINMNRVKKLDRQEIFFDREVESIHVSRQQAEFVRDALFRFLRGEQT